MSLGSGGVHRFYDVRVARMELGTFFFFGSGSRGFAARDAIDI